VKISLSSEVERLIAEKLQTGRYRSADEVVREGLELLQEREKQAHPPASNHTGDLASAFEAIAKEIPNTEWEKLPADLSTNVDHYLYGGPKTS
jgi:putative addiction module CopG family antidote